MVKRGRSSVGALFADDPELSGFVEKEDRRGLARRFAFEFWIDHIIHPVDDLAGDFGLVPPGAGNSQLVAYVFLMARLATAIGALVLVHNLYVNAAPANRWSIQLLCIGLPDCWVTTSTCIR